jgi:hypothetical protein
MAMRSGYPYRRRAIRARRCLRQFATPPVSGRRAKLDTVKWGTVACLCVVVWISAHSAGAEAPAHRAEAPAYAAQEAVNYGSVSGRVVDQSGAIVSGADVTALHGATNTQVATRTDEGGRFRFPYLTIGTWDITVRAAGFAPAVRRVSLSVGAAFDLPITLQIGTLDAAVTVTAASLLESARSQIAATVSRAEVEAVPLNGRNFLDVALLAPGVSPTNVGGGTQLFPETSAVPGVGLSISSQRNLSNNFMVDGLSANDDAAALSGMSFSVDAIEQFQVVTSGGQAELGRALGGHINIATRSGSNRATGDAYLFLRDARLNARHALSGTRLPMHQNQFGLSAGGPIVRDRTFYFANIERRQLDQSGLVTIGASNPAVVDQINARLGAVGYDGPRVASGVYANPIDTTHVLGKIDHRWPSTDLFTVRYSLYDVRSHNARGAGGLNAASASAGIDNTDQTVAVSNIRTIGPRLLLESRGQIAHGDLHAPPADPIGPFVTISGIASFGTSSTSPTRRRNTLYQLVNNITHQNGPHAVRVGVDLLVNDDEITYPRAVRGSYAFSSLTNFLSSTYNNLGFTQTFGDSVVQQTNTNVGVYVQDEWRLHPRVTLNAGLRYDLQYLETITTDTNNVSPRLGMVYSPLESSGLLLRASAGRFYDRVPLRPLANALLSAGNTTDPARLRQIVVSLSPGQTGAPAFPAVLGSVVPTATPVNFTTMDRALEHAYSDQASIEVERQIGGFSSVTAGYDHLRGRNLLMQINQNVPSCVVAGGNNGCRPNAAHANHNQYSSAGSSVYDGLHVSFVQRPRPWGAYRVSYTYSESMNDVGEAFFNGPIDPFDLSKDWARSDDDQRHRLVVSGSVNTPMTPARSLLAGLTHGFALSWMVQYYSALPFNITTGANTIQGTQARPVVNGTFIPRNAGEGTPFSTTSLRVSRGVMIGGRARVEGLVEAFNLFNRRNDLARVGVFGPGTYPDTPAANFGAVTAVGEPRALQFGVRLRY